MRTRIWKRLVVLGIGAVLLLAQMQPALAAEPLYPEIDHKPMTVDYDMEMPALSEMEDLAAKIREKAAGGDEDGVIDVYEKMLVLFDEASTAYYITDINTARDVTDEDAEQKNQDYYEAYLVFYETMMDAIQEVIASDGGAALKASLSEQQIEDIENYVPTTDEEKAELLQEKQLVADYNRVMAEEVIVTLDGKEYSSEDMEELYDDNEKFLDFLYEYEKIQNEKAGEIYLELLQLRDKMARDEGYDSYIDYANTEVYYRDYTDEDLERFFAGVKDCLLDVSEDLESVIYGGETPDNLPGEADEAEIAAAIKPHIGEVDPRLLEAWEYMEENDLLDMEESSVRLDGAFTQDFPDQRAAYIFARLQGTYTDYTTLVHEYGHFNAAFHNDKPNLWRYYTVDSSEVQSQGLEVMYIPYWEDICGDKAAGEFMGVNSIYDMISAVIQGCMFFECEKYAFEHPDSTLDELNRAFAGIYSEYGCDYLAWGDIAYDWVQIEHLFSVPGYYVSYATSAIGALTLFSEAQDDRDAAVEQYMRISACSDVPFMEMCRTCGLPDVFSEETMTGVAEAASDYLDQYLSDEEVIEEEPVEEPEEIEEEIVEEAEVIEEAAQSNWWKVILIAAGCWLIFLIAALVLARKGKKERAARQQQMMQQAQWQQGQQMGQPGQWQAPPQQMGQPQQWQAPPQQWQQGQQMGQPQQWQTPPQQMSQPQQWQQPQQMPPQPGQQMPQQPQQPTDEDMQ